MEGWVTAAWCIWKTFMLLCILIVHELCTMVWCTTVYTCLSWKTLTCGQIWRLWTTLTVLWRASLGTTDEWNFFSCKNKNGLQWSITSQVFESSSWFCLHQYFVLLCFCAAYILFLLHYCMQCNWCFPQVLGVHICSQYSLLSHQSTSLDFKIGFVS